MSNAYHAELGGVKRACSCAQYVYEDPGTAASMFGHGNILRNTYDLEEGAYVHETYINCPKGNPVAAKPPLLT